MLGHAATSFGQRALALALASSLSACTEAPSEEAPPEGPLVEASIIVVRPEALEVEDELPGRVSAFRVAEVRPQVGGIVRRRLFTEGEQVRQGQTLYQIDAATFRAEVAGARATRERNIAVLAQATREAERSRRLAESRALSEQAAEDAEARRNVAEAELALSAATLARSRLNLRFASVAAPIAGHVGISRITEGALVSPSDPLPLVTIQQIDQVYVDIKQPASRLDALRSGATQGEESTVTILALDGQPYPTPGRLLFTDINVDPTTGEVTLRVLVPNPDARLLPGMFVRARIPSARDPEAIAVPQQAVLHDPSLGARVLVVDASEQVALRPVVTGRVVGGRYVVREGLAAGDRVIVEGLERFTPGMRVRPVPYAPPQAASIHP